MLDLEDDRIFISRHVVFHETIFPLASTSDVSSWQSVLRTSVFLILIPNRSVPSPDTQPHANALSPPQFFANTSSSIAVARRRRPTRPPTYLSDYITASIPLTCSTNYPLQHYVGNAKLSSHYNTFVMSITSQSDPQTYAKAVQQQV